jgi:mRNA-degrading endonuclease RelE of RelBE toxin-antitoxin system
VTYTVVLAPSARRDLNKLPEAVVAAVFEFIGGPLAENPQRVGKPLGGDLTGLHSARRGSYRIIYRIVDDVVQVQVIRVRYRATAYRHD